MKLLTWNFSRLLLTPRDKSSTAMSRWKISHYATIRWAWMEVIQRGAYEFLPKPFGREDLEHYVVQAVERHGPVERRKQ